MLGRLSVIKTFFWPLYFHTAGGGLSAREAIWHRWWCRENKAQIYYIVLMTYWYVWQWAGTNNTWLYFITQVIKPYSMGSLWSRKRIKCNFRKCHREKTDDFSWGRLRKRFIFVHKESFNTTWVGIDGSKTPPKEVWLVLRISCKTVFFLIKM